VTGPGVCVGRRIVIVLAAIRCSQRAEFSLSWSQRFRTSSSSAKIQRELAMLRCGGERRASVRHLIVTDVGEMLRGTVM
jgi:hypothetical protein